MNRRNFLKLLMGTAASAAIAPVLDLDKLLWVPGAKTIFIPAAPVIEANCFLTVDYFCKEALDVLLKNLRFQKIMLDKCAWPRHYRVVKHTTPNTMQQWPVAEPGNPGFEQADKTMQ